MSEINLVAKRGDDEEYEFTITVADGGPFDLTDCDLAFTAKRLLTDPDSDAVIVKTLGDGITVTDAENGEATLVIASADTVGLTVDRRGLHFYYDIQVTESDGLISTPIEGRLTVRSDVTGGSELG